MTSHHLARRWPVSVPLHVGVLALVATAMVGLWAAPEQALAVGHLRDLTSAAVVYAIAWAYSRRAGRGSSAQLVVAIAGAVAGGWFLAQYRHLSPDLKVGWADAIGQATSGPFGAGPWAPLPNSVATLLEGMVVVALGLVLSTQPRPVRAIALTATAVMVVALVVTASRGAWLGVAVALLAAGLTRWLGERVIGALASLALAGAVVVAWTALAPGTPWFLDWAAMFGRPDRVDVCRHALTLLADAPFSGTGGGAQFADALSRFALLIEVPFLTYSHSLPLEIWLEHGLPGLAAWGGLTAVTVVAAVAGERAALGWRFRGLWAGVLAVQVHALSDARQAVDPWTWWPCFAILGLVAGALTAHRVKVMAAMAVMPAVYAVLIAAAALAGRGDPRAAWQANLGAIAQARAERETDAGRREAGRAAARAFFAAALSTDPDDVPALRRQGLLALAVERYADAVTLLQRAWRLDAGNQTTRKALGLAATWTGDLDLALAVLTGVPGMVAELNTWSRWRADRVETQLAVRAAQVSLALDPSQPELAVWLSTLLAPDETAPRR